MGRGQTSVHTNATLSASGSQAITGLGEVEIVLVVNVTVPPTGISPTLQYALQSVDPGNNSSPYGSPVMTAAISSAGVYMATVPKIDGDVLISWTVSGGSFTGIFATILLGSASVPSTSQVTSSSLNALADQSATTSPVALGSLAAGPNGILVRSHPANDPQSKIRVATNAAANTGVPLAPGESFTFALLNASGLQILLETSVVGASKVCVMQA